MKLAIVVAIAQDGAIGRGGDLLWHLPADLKRFKALTTGHTILMGRKTFESLPKGALPNRRNVVISHHTASLPGAEVYPSIADALEALLSLDEEVYVIGGGEIYRQLLPSVERIYLTRVEATFPDADTFFPELDMSLWREVERTYFAADAQNELTTELVILDRCSDTDHSPID